MRSLKMRKPWLAVALLTLVLSVFVAASFLNRPATPPSPSPAQLAAANYLKSHFNETIGLVYESEDNGTQVINGTIYNRSQIYYIYSDNLLAEWALKPYEPQTSDKINQTIQTYNLLPSDFFEVLFGEAISSNLCNSFKKIIRNNDDSIVLAESRNSSDPIRGQYADAMIYQSLNCYLKGNLPQAKQYLNDTLPLWDGQGINDDATKNDSKYANYKLALILYDSMILDFKIDPKIEQQLWSMQQDNGGITSLADLNGNPIGSSNAETTSMALLPYNTQLVSEMQALFGTANS